MADGSSHRDTFPFFRLGERYYYLNSLIIAYSRSQFTGYLSYVENAILILLYISITRSQ